MSGHFNRDKRMFVRFLSVDHHRLGAPPANTMDQAIEIRV